MELVQPIMMIFWVFFLIFAYCESGEKLSIRFDEINDIIYQCDWHSFPIEVQKILPIIMEASQKQVRLNGFGNIPFLRETFKGVILFYF